MNDKLADLMKEIDLLRSAYRKAERAKDAVGLKILNTLIDKIIFLIAEIR